MDSKYMALAIFLTSFGFSLSPTVLLLSKRLRRMYNTTTIVSAGLLLAILFMDFIPHIVNGGSCSHSHHSHGCSHVGVHSHHTVPSLGHTHSHNHTKPFIGRGTNGIVSKIVDILKNCHSGLFIAGLTFILLVIIDQKIIKHSHCDKDENKTHNESHTHSSIKIDTNKHTHSERHAKHTHSNDSISMCCTEGLRYKTTTKQALVFIFVFSIHSIFEGLVFSPTSQNNVLFIGLLVHKILESISMGMALFSSSFSKLSCSILLMFYSILTPLGIVTASKISSTLNAWYIKELFLGLSFGSLSFIVLVEMLPPIFHSLKDISKILYLLLGYIIGSSLIVIAHAQ
ncbi:solute carrier family 39 (zinc transporter), member 1/2/3 [Nematocida sp. AWRm80]|nr:solute carrier family 39 (zinc transporter), member 1/2/3 [Nematocida sp. AWRm80]